MSDKDACAWIGVAEEWNYWKQRYPAKNALGRIPEFGVKAGDRVRIREGYEDAGSVGFYVGKSNAEADMAIVDYGDGYPPMSILAAAIEPYPYSREERIERAIEDYEALAGDVADKPALFAVMEARL